LIGLPVFVTFKAGSDISDDALHKNIKKKTNIINMDVKSFPATTINNIKQFSFRRKIQSYFEEQVEKDGFFNPKRFSKRRGIN